MSWFSTWVESRSKSTRRSSGNDVRDLGQEAGEQLQRRRELRAVDQLLGLARLLDRDLLVEHDDEAPDATREVGVREEVHRSCRVQPERSTRRVRMPSSNVHVASPTMA